MSHLISDVSHVNGAMIGGMRKTKNSKTKDVRFN